ncbi:MAG TPA: DoxX family protein [Pyrinomonadaceae bacterium]|nr:DoxX family protein [Pyrinomonadaceae bacterium]
MNVLLWILQVLLALLFLFAGGTKLVLPIEYLTQQGSPNQVMMPGWFIRFIGVCEVLGALGLVLPGLLKTRQYLTPLAALGLAIIMLGAVVLTLMGDGFIMAITPFVCLLLLLFIAYARWRVRPHGPGLK